MKSMIPALIIGKMESLAATIAETYTNEKLSESGRVPMHKLFDMVAGTSSGSIVAAGVSFKSDNSNPMSGADISAFIVKNGEALF